METPNLFRLNRFSNNDRCAIADCDSTARRNQNLSFHRFPMANVRFVYKPGNVPGKVEKMDMQEVWKAKTEVTKVNSKSKICSLHFTNSDYIYGGTSTRRTLKRSAVPSHRLPGYKSTSEELVNSIQTPISQLLQENEKKSIENIHNEGQELAESTSMTTSNKICMLLKCIKSEKDLQIATGIPSYSILNTIIKMSRIMFLQESDIMTVRNRIVMTYVKLKQNLDYSFLAILFNCSGAEQCEQIFYSTLKILSRCFKNSISLPLYEETSESWPKHFNEIKIILDCVDIYMEGHENSYNIIIGSSLGGLISYIGEPYEKDECNTDIFQKSSLTKLLKPGDGILLDSMLSLEEIFRINNWKCIRPKTGVDQAYLGRFDEKIKSFELIKSIIPDRIVPVIEEIFIVICGTINIEFKSQSIPVVEID